MYPRGILFSTSYSSIALSGDVISTPPISNITAFGGDIEDGIVVDRRICRLRCSPL
jgi:hypothetical protein